MINESIVFDNSSQIGFLTFAHCFYQKCGTFRFKVRQLQMNRRNFIAVDFGMKNQSR